MSLWIGLQEDGHKAGTGVWGCAPVLVQGLAVQLPGQLSVELRIIAVLHWVCGQVFTIEAGLDHQTETLDLWKVSTLGRKAGLTARVVFFKGIMNYLCFEMYDKE